MMYVCMYDDDVDADPSKSYNDNISLTYLIL